MPNIFVNQQRIRLSIAGVGPQGPQGPPGTSASGIELPFAYGDATPAVIATVPANKAAYQATIEITTPFNGVGAQLSIGDSGDSQRLMPTTGNSPGEAGAYHAHPVHVYGGSTAVNLYITPGAGASSGSGIVRLFIQS